MTSTIVLPTLSKWAEQHITALLTATSETSFNEAYDAFFAKNAKITVNGQHLSREEYRKQLWDGKGPETGAQVAFTGAVEVPDNANKPLDSGNVGLFLQATIDEKFLVLGVSEPESSTVTASTNITIIQDPTLRRAHGSFDGRRVSVLNKVSVKTQPINPGGPNIPTA